RWDVPVLLDALIGGINPNGGSLISEEKKIAVSFLSAAREVIGLGDRHFKSARNFMESGLKYLEMRKRSAESIVRNIKASRVEGLRRLGREREAALLDWISDIEKSIQAGKPAEAVGPLYELLKSKRLRNEPEYKYVKSLIIGVIISVKKGETQEALEKLEIAKKRVQRAGNLHHLMQLYRDKVAGTGPNAVDDSARPVILNDVFINYAENSQLLRGSPKEKAIMWAYLYLAAFVKRNVYADSGKSKKKNNPVFDAILKYIFVLDFDKVADVVDRHEINGPIREFLRSLKRDHIVREDLARLIESISLSYGLDASEKEVLKKCVYVEGRADAAGVPQNDIARQQANIRSAMTRNRAFFDNNIDLLCSKIGALSAGPAELAGERPIIEISVSLDIFKKENLQFYASMLAYIVFKLRKLDNVRFVIEPETALGADRYFPSLEKVFDKSADDFAFYMKRVIMVKYGSSLSAAERESIYRRITIFHEDPLTAKRVVIGVPIMSKCFIDGKGMKKVAESLAADQYPVVVDDTSKNGPGEKCIVGLEGAVVVALAKGFYYMLRETGKHDKDGGLAALDNVRAEFAGRLTDLYKRLGRDFSESSLAYFFADGNALQKLGQAMDFMIPPVARMPIAQMQEAINLDNLAREAA
ncbi:MAG: hypothetical protein HQL28_03285, partial [Candidatus Omnitrophica bacterium]|nr:hypothetical protein [Candidatus Omnitrophota bacterium]